MSKYLCTFPGKFGDILWSLPTARAISEMVGEPVDFAVMPYYAAVCKLIEAQPYISKAFAVPDWLRLHSNYGDQPWHTPKHVEHPYERVWHLGYRAHPGIGAPNMPLIDFVAYQQGIRFSMATVRGCTPLPFLDSVKLERGPYVAYAFNDQYADVKAAFLSELLQHVGDTEMVDASASEWADAPHVIANAACFVGCRSANYVVAHGVSQQVVCFEPHPARHATGHLGIVFGCPYGRETSLPFNMPVEEQAKAAASLVLAKLAARKEVAA